MSHGLTRGEAIAAHCMWCVGKHGREGRTLTDACPITWCALYDYRPKLRPEDIKALQPKRPAAGVS
jgi:hypothetical protein